MTIVGIDRIGGFDSAIPRFESWRPASQRGLCAVVSGLVRLNFCRAMWNRSPLRSAARLAAYARIAAAVDAIALLNRNQEICHE